MTHGPKTSDMDRTESIETGKPIQTSLEWIGGKLILKQLHGIVETSK